LYKKIFDQHRKSFLFFFLKGSFLDGIQLWFLNTKIWFDDDFLVVFLDGYVSFFFFEFFKGPFLWVFFNAIGISPLVMFLLEILWWLHHLSIFLLSLFFSLVDFFVSGQHIDLPLFPLAVGAKWKNVCIFFVFVSKSGHVPRG